MKFEQKLFSKLYKFIKSLVIFIGPILGEEILLTSFFSSNEVILNLFFKYLLCPKKLLDVFPTILNYIKYVN